MEGDSVKMLILLVLLIPMISAADEEVLWDYDFHTLPPGWDATWLWGFSGEGASLHASIGGYSGCTGGDMGSFDTSVLLPEGIDSLVITADQSLSLAGTNDYSEAGIYVSFNQGVNWMEVYYAHSPFSGSDPVHICLAGITMAGLPFQIKFIGTAYGSNYGGSLIHWDLENFLLTAYGNNLSLEQWTWGGIKSAAGY